MDAGEGWIPLNRAAECLAAIFESREFSTGDSVVRGTALDDEGLSIGARKARIELLDEMKAGRLSARAIRWTESGEPNTYHDRGKPVRLGNKTVLVPSDFWERGHAWDGHKAIPVDYLRTFANWSLLRFESYRTVNGGRPGWSDRWGLQIIGHGPKIWQWDRVAVGIEIDEAVFQDIVAAYSVSLVPPPQSGRRPTLRGYRLADEPLVLRGAEMVRNGQAKSAHHAATLLADEALGASHESRIRRLAPAIKKTLESSEPSEFEP